MRWPWQRKRDAEPGDSLAQRPARAWTFDNVPPWLVPQEDLAAYVGTQEALSISAFWRGMQVISQSIAGMTLRTVSEATPGVVKPVSSIFDEPEGPYGRTKFEWLETSVLFMALQGDVFYRHRWTGAGSLYALEIIPSQNVSVTWGRPAGEAQEDGGTVPPVGGKWYRVTYTDGPFAGRQEVIDAREMTQIPYVSLDGLRGMSILTLARRGLSTAISGDRAADRMFRSGARVAGMVTPDDDLELDEANEARRQIDNATAGVENTGKIALFNRKLTFTPWMLSAADAQFLQSRQHSVEEMARWTGVPPHLLMQTAKATSWGSGLAEQNEGLSRYTLNGWTARLEPHYSRLLPRPRRVEFDYFNLTRPTFAELVHLMIEATGGPVYTSNEGRSVLGLAPVPGGDELTAPAAPAADTAPDDEPDREEPTEDEGDEDA